MEQVEQAKPEQKKASLLQKLNPVLQVRAFLIRRAIDLREKELKKKQVTFNQKFKELYTFFKNVDGTIVGRKAKKQFWGEFISDGRMPTQIFHNVVNNSRLNKEECWVDITTVKLNAYKLTKELNNLKVTDEEAKTVSEIMARVNIKAVLETTFTESKKK